MLRRVEKNKRLWQVVAEHYNPPSDPWAIYAPDRRIGAFHAGTLAINFQPGGNPITLHNPFCIDQWPGGYPLRVPEEWSMNDFHDGYDPFWVAAIIGYTLEVGADDPLVEPLRFGDEGQELPRWVEAYMTWLKQQMDRYGEVQVRMLRPDPDGAGRRFYYDFAPTASSS